MLTKCPECELPVSDKALTCPHCGYPLKTFSKNPTRGKSRIRLPNGFGQISEIKNRNLRNPWRVMITVGKTSEGRPICKILKPQGYFKTYNDAYTALVEYNKSPYDLDDDIRMSALYDKWTDSYFDSLKSDSSRRTITAAWGHCKPLYDMRVKDVRARHIKGCMDEAPSENIKSRIKSVCNLMLDYAVEYELVEKNYARTFNLDPEISKGIEEKRREHVSFTDEEMVKLWANINAPYVDLILVQCYMGWRPQELCALKTADVNITEGWVKGGMKTDAGRDRIVPIHSCVRELVEGKYKQAIASNGEYLFTDDGKPLTYDKYRTRFNKVVKALELNPEHRAHDPRKQFVTMAKKYNMDEYAIKKIVGHEIDDITEKIYTDRGFDWLKAEMEKIRGVVNSSNSG